MVDSLAREPGFSKNLGAATAAGAGWLLAAVLWLLTLTGHGAPRRLQQAVVALAAAATAVLIVRALRRRPLLALVVAVALTFGFAGLGHEVGKGYYTDEGHYLHHAREVNDGKLFTTSFVYPHLLYYLDAFALHAASLFRAPTSWVAALYGVRDPAVTEWLVLRLVGAALGALTVVPVFLLARRLFRGVEGGENAALFASGLAVFSVHYQEGFQVNISDVPSAAFATLCLAFVGRLLDGERTRDYVLAGVASGLAASAKYPAGVVALAIVGVWIVHRVRRREWHPGTWRWGLLWAGLASIAVFLALHPSLFVHTEAALYGRRGFLFGARQYSKGGWVGVMPPSITAYYAARIAESAGWAALLLLPGALGLARKSRRRLAMLLPFPLAFLVLICSMNMVVLRNLFPVLPALAVFFGAAASGAVELVARRRPERRRTAALAVAVVLLAQPFWGTLRQTVGLVRPSTRDVMSAWMLENLPPGTGVLKESYTPNFYPHELKTMERRFAYRIPAQQLKNPEYEYLLLAGSAFWRFFRPENDTPDRREWYENVFENYELVHEVEGDAWRRGPLLRLYRLPAR